MSFTDHFNKPGAEDATAETLRRESVKTFLRRVGVSFRFVARKAFAAHVTAAFNAVVAHSVLFRGIGRAVGCALRASGKAVWFILRRIAGAIALFTLGIFKAFRIAGRVSGAGLVALCGALAAFARRVAYRGAITRRVFCRNAGVVGLIAARGVCATTAFVARGVARATVFAAGKFAYAVRPATRAILAVLCVLAVRRRVFSRLFVRGASAVLCRCAVKTGEATAPARAKLHTVFDPALETAGRVFGFALRPLRVFGRTLTVAATASRVAVTTGARSGARNLGTVFARIVKPLAFGMRARGLSGKTVFGIAGGAVAVAAAAVVLTTFLYAPSAKDAWYVTLDGERIGYVTDENAFALLIKAAKADIEAVSPDFDVSRFVCEQSDEKLSEVEVLTARVLVESVPVDDASDAWAVKINGETVAVAATRRDAESVLERVKTAYLNAGSELIEAEFAEDVQVEAAVADTREISDVDTAVTLILTGTKEPRIYTVVKGDTFWDIAITNRIARADLLAANPGITPEKLRIGQQINLYEIRPYVTVRTTEIASKVEALGYSTVYENSADLYKGQTRIVTPGVTGSREVRQQITKENGIVVASLELGSDVTAEPMNQVALVGTKPLTTFTGTGSLMSPLARIEVSSAYGSRGNRRHQGVDLRSPKGTPVYASDDGVVTTSQYKGSYGNLIILNHGNGLETYYAHCDTLNVSVGDVVSKGQMIGTVGITGNATGYHLHFEVRLNGVYQNPLNYF